MAKRKDVKLSAKTIRKLAEAGIKATAIVTQSEPLTRAPKAWRKAAKKYRRLARAFGVPTFW
jgi:hypothetical protein